MPAQSKQQQKLFGLALAVKRGEVPRSEASKEVLDIVDSMSEKSIRDFASTKHKGLPKKSESMLQLKKIIREEMWAINEGRHPDKVRKYMFETIYDVLFEYSTNKEFRMLASSFAATISDIAYDIETGKRSIEDFYAKLRGF